MSDDSKAAPNPAAAKIAQEEALQKKTDQQHAEKMQQRVHMWSKRSTLRTRVKDPVMCVAFSTDDSLLAVGYFDGTLVIFDMHSLGKLHELSMIARKTEDRDKLPVTAMEFRPTGTHHPHFQQQPQQTEQQQPKETKTDDASSTDQKQESDGQSSPAGETSAAAAKTGGSSPLFGSLRPILLVCCSNGQWHQFDANSAECLRSNREQDNEIYACAYNNTGQAFATAGRDAFVRIYDDRSGEVKAKYTIQSPGSGVAPLRIYSLAWHVTDPHIVYAGGWSQTVTAFDTRSRDGYVEPARRKDIFGPILMGNAMALVPRTGEIRQVDNETFLTSEERLMHAAPFDIFTASHRMDERLELFDANSMVKVADLPWPNSSQQFLPMCAAASNDGDFLALGGGGGQGFMDGAFVVVAPSASKRHHAASAAAAMKMEEHKHQIETGEMGASSSGHHHHQTVDFLHHQHAEAKKRPLMSVAPLAPVVELRQPGRSVVVAKFSQHSNYVVFGDTEGLLHMFEAPYGRRMRH